jgi:hypothetical protein
MAASLSNRADLIRRRSVTRLGHRRSCAMIGGMDIIRGKRLERSDQ